MSIEERGIESAFSSQDNMGQTVSEIIDLQKECSEYVYQQREEEVKELLKNDNFFLIKEDGKIVVSAYKDPLLDNISDEEQIYRLGGLSIKGFKDSKLGNRKKFIGLLLKLAKYIEDKNYRIILETDNPVFARFLTEIGGERLSYEECKLKYPNFLDAYIKKLKKPESCYEGQIFYVRDKKMAKDGIN